jgi:hypothetical protein
MPADRIDLIDSFLNGVIVMGHATAGLFFLRFWKRTGDRLFIMFATAFWLLGVIHALLVALNQSAEVQLLYGLRLAAYLLILAAIIDKNVRK